MPSYGLGIKTTDMVCRWLDIVPNGKNALGALSFSDEEE